MGILVHDRNIFQAALFTFVSRCRGSKSPGRQNTTSRVIANPKLPFCNPPPALADLADDMFSVLGDDSSKKGLQEPHTTLRDRVQRACDRILPVNHQVSKTINGFPPDLVDTGLN